MKENNKFNKTLAQFYLEPISSNSLTKVSQSSFVTHRRRFRTKKVVQLNKKIQEKKQRSLLNFASLSKVFEAQQKVFRSSSSFFNPEKAGVTQTNKSICTLLKSQILQKDFKRIRLENECKKQQNKQRYQDAMISNYGYFTESFLQKKKKLDQKKEALTFRYQMSGEK